jgi:hypothetical protein
MKGWLEGRGGFRGVGQGGGEGRLRLVRVEVGGRVSGELCRLAGLDPGHGSCMASRTLRMLCCQAGQQRASDLHSSIGVVFVVTVVELLGSERMDRGGTEGEKRALGRREEVALCTV